MTVATVNTSSVAVVAADPERRRRIEAAAERAGCPSCGVAAALSELTDSGGKADVFLMALGAGRTADEKSIAEARALFPDAHVLIVLATPSSRDRRFAAIGADGVIYEDALERMLGPALSALESGLAVLPHELFAGQATPTLSSREKQVLAMVVMGFTNMEIATKLYLAESTVKSHLSSSFRKLGVTSRKDAAARILDPDSGLGAGILAISSDGVASLSARGAARNGIAAA